ncbi:hypothetical protein BDY17DRAFT_251074 [Neohortaea acidophila]|uniref:Uncharacterized protein n=1 Tax=Neohortaea acidophila TaxID=245834 RepID=A0A6A6PU10_9PEZI|nr:uncharacterized protein BDY17DRAFT_251074 [Neohortaea acidophila]KAF2483580.1 hypothetical protein BDY17DRAFT_251074 [Neohortaea acidophila]
MGRDVAIAEAEREEQDRQDDVPPPPYGEQLGRIKSQHQGFGTNANVGDDGRVNIRIDQRSSSLSNILAPALRHQEEARDDEPAPPPPYIPPSLGGEEGVPPPPPMTVVIQVVGSRGDVQPFVALGKVLQETYGHRVRLATHPVFQQFVTENGLEFFSIGGDPAQLMAFMVKNPGLMPGFDSLRSGDIGNRRREVGEYLRGCWRSCYEAGNGLGPAAADDTLEQYSSEAPEDVTDTPFVADCIIANPPSFAHAHIAEKMGIPLHIMFTMPYSPTQAFPHPLANIQSSNADPKLTNYISYSLIDMLTWQGLGDVINRFRQKSLGLEPVSLLWAPGMLQRLKVPHTYCWSPALIPKPKDWGQNIHISGFFFLNLASNYTPEPDLKAFLDAGPPPVYIGFGSIVLDDPNAMTELIFEAVRTTGQRVLLSKGWGGMGAEELGIPEGVFMLGNVPHDWLFQHVSCVIHHGGAGTTAAGITAGKPTVVVPFFGDQPFWGSMVARAGAGPEPLPHKELTAEKLADAINFCLKPESQAKAKELASKIAREKGSDVGAQSFHQMLDVDKLRCMIAPSRPAVWRVKRTQVRLSAVAACTLANEGLLSFSDLKLFRAREYETEDGPWDPITGSSTAIVGTVTQMMMGVADLPIETLKALNIHPDAQKKKRASEAGQDLAENSETTKEGTTQSSDQDSAGTETAITSESSTPAYSRQNSSAPTVRSSDSASNRHLSGATEPQRPRGDSLKEALSGRLNEPSPAAKRSASGSSSRSASPRGEPTNYLETAVGTSKGVGRILSAAFKSPMDTSWALAKGFHNAPKLYGDDTVRKTEQITDFRTGLKAASKGFGYGLYDGITGFVTQPVQGAQKEGAAGFVKGFGKGLGGIVLKPSAAFWAIPGYTMKGVYKELKLQSGSSVQNYIIASRTAQGWDEWSRCPEDKRAIIVQRWKGMQKDIKKKRNPDEIVREILDEKRRKAQDWKQDLKAGWEEKKSRSRNSSIARARTGSTGAFNQSATTPGMHDQQSAALHDEARPTGPPHARTYEDRASHLSYDELDEAISQSVQQTSKGNHNEDEAVEKAIRASMTELYKSRTPHSSTQAPSNDDDDPDLKRALEASAAEAQKQDNQADPLYDEELERALANSLREHRREFDSSADTEDDEDYQRAVRESQGDGPITAKAGGGEKSQAERTEEEIVMEYVKKQSLLEQQHRQSAASKSPGNEEEDEELQQALKASMQGQAGPSNT